MPCSFGDTVFISAEATPNHVAADHEASPSQFREEDAPVTDTLEHTTARRPVRRRTWIAGAARRGPRRRGGARRPLGGRRRGPKFPVVKMTPTNHEVIYEVNGTGTAPVIAFIVGAEQRRGDRTQPADAVAHHDPVAGRPGRRLRQRRGPQPGDRRGIAGLPDLRRRRARRREGRDRRARPASPAPRRSRPSTSSSHVATQRRGPTPCLSGCEPHRTMPGCNLPLRPRTLQTEAPTMAAHLYELKQVTGAEITFGGTRAGADSPAVLSTFVGSKSEALRGVQVELGRGLGGKAMSVGRPDPRARLRHRARHHPRVRRAGEAGGSARAARGPDPEPRGRHRRHLRGPAPPRADQRARDGPRGRGGPADGVRGRGDRGGQPPAGRARPPRCTCRRAAGTSACATSTPSSA